MRPKLVSKNDYHEVQHGCLPVGSKFGQSIMEITISYKIHTVQSIKYFLNKCPSIA